MFWFRPKSLFTETKPPSSFQTTPLKNSTTTARFKYIPPKTFDHELPSQAIPEIAFLGRSNVGKSSLLNSLTHKHLARISKTPGRTQQVNYFGLFQTSTNDHRSEQQQQQQQQLPLGFLIDLPGYGYAKAPEANVEEWQANTQNFIEARIEHGNLQRIYILVDSRRGLSGFDSSILGWLDEAGCDYTLVLTKSDAVGRAKLIKVANDICMRHHMQTVMGDDVAGLGFQSPFVHLTSSKKNEGIVDLMWAIENDFTAGMSDRNNANGWSKQ